MAAPRGTSHPHWRMTRVGELKTGLPKPGLKPRGEPRESQPSTLALPNPRPEEPPSGREGWALAVCARGGGGVRFWPAHLWPPLLIHCGDLPSQWGTQAQSTRNAFS